MVKTVKKYVLAFVVMLGVIGVFALVNPLKVNADGLRTRDEAVQWARSQVGKAIGGGECVDFIKAYYSYLGVTPVTGNGSNYTGNTLPANWIRIPNAQPQPGDILVYTGGNGHVAIYEADRITYHQNFSSTRSVLKITYAYNRLDNPYWGVIRPAYKNTTPVRVPVNLGTDFTAIILRTDIWKPLRVMNGQVSLQKETGQIYEHWRFIRQSDGSYIIKSLYSGMVLDVYNGSNASGTRVNTFTQWGEDNGAQKWFVYGSGAAFALVPKCAPNLTLDAISGGTSDGTFMQLFTPNGTGAQVYSIYQFTGVGINSINLSVENSTALYPGNTKKIKYTYKPQNAYYIKVTYSSSNPAVATVSADGTVTGKKPGTATITCKSHYTDKVSAQINIKVYEAAKQNQILSGTTSYTKIYGNSAFSLNVERNKGDGKLTYATSNPKVATVLSNGKVNIKGTGKAVITVTAAETGKYKKASKAVTIIIKPKKAATPVVKSNTKKKAQVLWKRDIQAAGYQIQYSTSQSFKSGNKTLMISKNSIVKKTLSGLKRKKKYYVRMRAYTIIDKNIVWGSWSNKRSVKVK